MQYIKTLDEHIHAITKDFEQTNHSADVAVSDHINNVYCALDEEAALEAVSIMMDECDELIEAANAMKRRLNAYRKEHA